MSEKPRRRGWLGVVAAAGILALCYGAFEFGRASAGYFVVSSMLERLDLRNRNQDLTRENDDLRHRVSVAEVGQKVDRQAQSDAQQMMGELQAETARFFVKAFADMGTLGVQELSVHAAEEDRRYRVLITLVQAATRDTIANGTVTFAVEGMRGMEKATLPLSDIEVDKRKQFPFSLRFFQQIEVPIQLPLDFEPERLHVEFQLGRNREPSKQTFDWRVEGEETPAL